MTQIHNLNSCENNDGEEGLDFMDYWSDQTVKREISRGLILRESKPVPFHSKELNTFKTQLNLNHYPTKVNRLKLYEKRSYIFKTKILPYRQKCSLRIIELAVPTKRHCIDTWRNKYHILPGFMLERLKRQVLDRQPIAQISDAHNCFKNRKRIKITSKRKKKATVNGKHKYPMDVKYFCALFCHKIVQKLNKSCVINIAFNSELDNLSKIVVRDIREIMQKRKRTASDSSFESKSYRKFYNEISVKVTIWLSNILEEASFMMLLDDLNELEEEEGPVLSFIDDLLYNVLHICQTNSPKLSESSDSTKSAIVSQQSGSLLGDENTKQYNGDQIIEEFVPDNDDVNNILVNEILTIIDSVIENANFYETDQGSESNTLTKKKSDELSIDSDKEITQDSASVDYQYTFKNNNFNDSTEMNDERENYYVNAEVNESNEKKYLIMDTQDFVNETEDNYDIKDESNHVRNVNETEDPFEEGKSTKTDQDDNKIDIEEQSSQNMNILEDNYKFNSKLNTEQNSHENKMTDKIKDAQEANGLENNRSIEGKLNTSDQESKEFVMSNTKDNEISNELDRKPSWNSKSNDSYLEKDETDIKDDIKHESNISINQENYSIEKTDTIKEIKWSFSLENQSSTDSDPNNKDQANDIVTIEKINENQKKVAFSELKLDKLSSATESSHEMDRSSAEKLLDLAPPNFNLLSDADEIWPKQMSFPSIHESISNLSASSLGRIAESDNSGSS